MSKLKYFDGTNWNEVNGNIVGDTLPIGAIVPFGGWDAPTGWLICDGTLLNKTAYPELFNVLGYSYGGEDGGSTFGLPDLRGRVPVGEKDSDSAFDGMGTTGGSKDAVVVAHYHSTEPISSYPGGNPGTHTGYGYEEIALSRSSYGNNTGTTGVSGTDKNLQPYQTVNYIIKAKQSAGVVANVSNTQSNSQVDTYSCDFINNIVPKNTCIVSKSGITSATLTSSNGYGRVWVLSGVSLTIVSFNGDGVAPTITDAWGTHSFTASINGKIITLSNLANWDHYIFMGTDVITSIN